MTPCLGLGQWPLACPTARHGATPPHERGVVRTGKDQPKCPRVSLLLAGTHLAPILAPGAGRSPLDSSKAADGIVANTHRVFCLKRLRTGRLHWSL